MSSDPNSAAPEAVISGNSNESAVNAVGPSTDALDSTSNSSPQPPGESASVDVAASSAEADAAEEARKQRIKIGTQRPGVAVPRVEPRTKVAFRTPPITTTAVTTSASSPAASLSRRWRRRRIQARRRKQGAEVKPPHREEPLDLPPAAPSIKFKDKPRKPRFEMPAAPTAKVEKPNLRAALSPELEAELQEALGEVPLDEIIAQETGATTGEILETETRLKGRVLRIFRDDVFIDLGGRNQGILTLHTLAKEPEVGAELEVTVNRFNAEDGLYELTTAGSSVDVGDWSDIAEGITVDAVITGHNKGGLEAEVNKIRGFIPAGQISIYRVENFEEFVGQRWACVVVEANAERRNLVLSRRGVLEREQAEAKEKLLAELEVGQVREGTVRNIRDFGAFVDIGGVDGMVHVSQMSWDRIKHPSEVLTVGQKVKVKIQKIDPETHKISLAYRDLFESPWTNAASKYPVTTRVTGTVSKIMDFGAFVKLEPGVEGLVHISELSYKRVHRVGDIVQEGQQVDAKVLSVDPENQRISLSMKAYEARPEPAKKEEQDSGAAGSASAPPEPPKKKKRAVPLQGGLGRSPHGDKFGLNW